MNLSPSIHIRSAWPTPIGKRLTDRMIAKYRKLGFYSHGIVQAEAKNTAVAKRKAAAARDISEFV